MGLRRGSFRLAAASLFLAHLVVDGAEDPSVANSGQSFASPGRLFEGAKAVLECHVCKVSTGIPFLPKSWVLLYAHLGILTAVLSGGGLGLAFVLGVMNTSIAFLSRAERIIQSAVQTKSSVPTLVSFEHPSADYPRGKLQECRQVPCPLRGFNLA